MGKTDRYRIAIPFDVRSNLLGKVVGIENDGLSACTMECINESIHERLPGEGEKGFGPGQGIWEKACADACGKDQSVHASGTTSMPGTV